jgi:hypothetical protein
LNDVTFYVQENLGGQPMPNDDLDIQLLWLCALDSIAPRWSIRFVLRRGG